MALSLPSASVNRLLAQTQTSQRHEKPLRIMKFGGTSVADSQCIEKVLEIIHRSLSSANVLVVVSAMAGVTDLLIQAGERSAAGDSETVSKVFTTLRQKHEAAARLLIHSRASRERVEYILQQRLLEGERCCEEISRAHELTPGASDLISSLGERLSAPLVAAALADRGVASEAVDSTECIVTDAHHGSANPSIDLTRGYCESRLRPMLRQGVVAVVTGFLAATVDGTVTTLGRGGSDYSATILGAALNAHEVIIWTDVNGVLTCDPRVVPRASTIPRISYRQAAALAYFGAKVLHPKTLHPVIQRGIPVWIRNTFAPEHEGTEVTLEEETTVGPAVKALSALTDVTCVTITASSIDKVSDLTHRVSVAITAARADLLSIFQTSSPLEIGIAIRSSIVARTKEALRNELGSDGTHNDVRAVAFRDELALVTVVGQNMSETSDIVARAFGALVREGLEILGSSRGSSDHNFSFLIDLSQTRRALKILHQELHLVTQ